MWMGAGLGCAVPGQAGGSQELVWGVFWCGGAGGCRCKQNLLSANLFPFPANLAPGVFFIPPHLVSHPALCGLFLSG